MSNAVVTDWPSGSANTGWPQEPTRMLLPGRVEGWPAGTQRAANPAQRLLSQAVAWWDVESYREGDRWLRNQGTGGDLLDLRLGSSVAPNSNDPLYLPTADDGYIYLSGVAGNSLSVTAPATATQYIAYPLDRSASTATGAVTGGATFTFSTAGSWRLIELLDASNVVVDTIDCDAITTGTATSFTAVSNQTVTINRSTSGRKSVAVPSRHKGGAPLMLLGTDDYLEVQDNWQHGLLNFDKGQSFTILVALRVFATPVNNSRIISKNDTASGGNPGWTLRFRTGPYLESIITDAVTAATSFTDNFTPNTVMPIVSVYDRASQSGQLTTGQTVAPNSFVASNRAVTSLANTLPVRVGRNSGATTSYSHMEFYGAAIFRRALSRAEVTTLTNYFTGRIA